MLTSSVPTIAGRHGMDNPLPSAHPTPPSRSPPFAPSSDSFSLSKLPTELLQDIIEPTNSSESSRSSTLSSLCLVSKLFFEIAETPPLRRRKDHLASSSRGMEGSRGGRTSSCLGSGPHSLELACICTMPVFDRRQRPSHCLASDN
ncbi:uncharacterized protein JCM6883_003512 [Sporobolomyces salmoneus]|uniref:uncharacterized protein n=1 Tax=Sporobolomyces salmoneus TaxID=183962 RepID=UPI003172304C